ncbi:hypothetical protein MASR2M47_12610 [Draconibacterium sp.]|jgi:hypothetical protein
MKKYLIAFSFLFVGITSQSQVLISLLLGDKLNSDKLEFGLEGGMNWSNTSGFESNDYARFFNLGFYFDMKVKNQWAFYTGVLVKSNVGVDKLTTTDLSKLGVTPWTEEGEYKQVINQFMVPALMKYNFKNHFYVEAGPEFGLRFKGYVEYNSDIDDIEGRTRQNNKDMLQKLDAGISGGIGYKLLKGEGWTIGAKYYHGFVDAFKDISGTKSSSINLKVNIPIGAGGKKPKD